MRRILFVLIWLAVLSHGLKAEGSAEGGVSSTPTRDAVWNIESTDGLLGIDEPGYFDDTVSRYFANMIGNLSKSQPQAQAYEIDVNDVEIHYRLKQIFVSDGISGSLKGDRLFIIQIFPLDRRGVMQTVVWQPKDVYDFEYCRILEISGIDLSRD